MNINLDKLFNTLLFNKNLDMGITPFCVTVRIHPLSIDFTNLSSTQCGCSGL